MVRKDYGKAASKKGPHDYVWKADLGIPASLIARLAEAADGIRNGRRIYFVAELTPSKKAGHDVIGYFLSPEKAFEHDKARESLESGKYLIFGPFQTQEDKDYEPKDVDRVVIYRRKGRPITLPGEKFDCVFWSLSAMDKFVIPYYTSLVNCDEAERVRKDFIDKASIAGIHIPGSDIVNDPGTEETTISLEEIRDRVGLYALREKGDHGGEGIEFIPL